MEYVVPMGALPGPNDLSVLPAFVGGTMNTLLLPRTDAAIAAIRAPHHDMWMNFKEGTYESTQRFMAGDVHAMTHLDHGFAVRKELVQFSEEPENPKAKFRFDSEALYDGPSIVARLQRHWYQGHRTMPAVHSLFRLQPAHVIGEISRHTAPGFINLDDDCHGYRSAINYADLPADERLLLICELPSEGDFTFYRGLRVVPLSLLGYEFTRWQRSNTDVIAELTPPE